MKSRILSLVLLSGLLAVAHAEVRLGEKTSVAFATVEQGREILARRDEFIQRLSPFDRAARMKSDQAIPEDVFLRFVATNVLAWPDNERALVESALSGLQPQLKQMALSWPETILLIKTTGQEEGRAAYTRGTAIVLPANELAPNRAKSLGNLIGHELFHILSRENPDLREKLYAAIGFQKCAEITFPSRLEPVKITNPDAPKNDHCIRLQLDGSPVWAVPILYSRTPNYDVRQGGEFFDYLEFKFLVVRRGDAGPAAAVTYDDTNLKLVGNRDVSGFLEQVGRNTGYTIHPEEILADNFALLLQGKERVPSPEILKQMKTILAETPATPPHTPAAADNARH